MTEDYDESKVRHTHNDKLTCPVCGATLVSQEIGDTTIWYCLVKHRAGTMIYDED